jgi:hypothetical protein
LGSGVFAKIFSKNIMIPSREIPFLVRLHNGFWVAQRTKFGYLGNNQIFGYSGDPKIIPVT